MRPAIESFLVLLPVFQRLQFLIQPQIAGMAALLYLAPPDSLQHGAAFFLGVAAPHESAVIQIGTELPEGLRKAVLQLQIQFVRFKGRKSRGIHHLGTAIQAIQLHVAGGVSPATQRVADFSHPKLKRRVKGIQDTGFSYAGVACKGR